LISCATASERCCGATFRHQPCLRQSLARETRLNRRMLPASAAPAHAVLSPASTTEPTISMAEFFQRHVIHNFGLKLISLFLAVGLWLAVSRDPVAEVAVEVPIEFHSIPENLELSSEGILQAQIRIRGPQRLLHGLQPSDVHPEVDLTGAKPG